MKQSKKRLTKICLNNWGGINHKILYLNEYVNLFSGKSGSGKSTVMDAIQVVLYGSFQQGFLNKAADDSKNRRSVLSYLRGAQKDGSSNRDNQDFCSTLAIEIEDTGLQTSACIGVSFEVRKADTSLSRYNFFSHAGKMPESEYINENNAPYTKEDFKQLLKERNEAGTAYGRADINRIYPSADAYRRTLYDVILGYIDGNRFATMEKSAIALQMTNGTGQFIRDYMFPKSSSGAIEKLSEQLGAYRDIKEKIDDLRQRIDLLTRVNERWNEKMITETDLQRLRDMLCYLRVQELEGMLKAMTSEQEQNLGEQSTLRKQQSSLAERRKLIEEELIQVRADLKASDLGGKEKQLQDLEKRGQMLAMNSGQWRGILQGLSGWVENEVINDYISSDVMHQIEQLNSGKITKEQCKELQELLEREKKYLEEQIEDDNQRKRQYLKELNEKKQMVDDMKNNRKPYPEELKKARAALQSRLGDRYGHAVHVYVFADLFDVKEKEWKDAVEGRMGRLKYSLITEPEFSHEAAVVFKNMRMFENVDLINAKAIVDSEPKPVANSLYEAVETTHDYADACLKRYLGHIVKCQSVDELEQVRDGVTPDCYSYSNFIFRHLRRKDYTDRACIGSKVSKSKLEQFEQEVEILQEKLDQVTKEAEGLKLSRDYESLKEDPEYLVSLSQAGVELEQVNEDREKLRQDIESLKDGKYHELDQKRQDLEKKKRDIDTKEAQLTMSLGELTRREGSLSSSIESNRLKLEEESRGFVASDALKKEVDLMLMTRSGQTIRNQTYGEISKKEEDRQYQLEALEKARLAFNREYPACGFNGMEQNNDGYDKLLEEYRKNYEPQYQEEFQKQCDFVYRSLRDNVIASIHGDIKAAKRHEYDINRLLKKTNFSDSTYQIEIDPAQNANGQFYQMLMAEELDSKNVGNDGFEGQLTLGEDEFYQKYQQQIELLTDKFMPIKEEDDEQTVLKKRREMEQYADYRNYLSFRMYERVVDEQKGTIRKNYVDDMAGRDSGGEGQNPKYVALLAGFAMLYMQQSNRDSKIKLVLLDEAFSKMDQERSAVCLQYARMMDLQLIVCVPDERLQSLIRNVDCVYGFRRHKNQISMMHIDKGDYLRMLEGDAEKDE